MIQKRFLKSLAAATTLLATVGTSAVAHAADYSSADVMGLKLGMSKEEASAIIAKHFGITEKDMTFYMGQLGYYDRSGQVKERVHVQFDNVDGAYVVNHIVYQLPGDTETKKSTIDAAIAKYGKPTTALPMMSYAWCEKKSSLGTCHSLDQAMIQVDFGTGNSRVILMKTTSPKPAPVKPRF